MAATHLIQRMFQYAVDVAQLTQSLPYSPVNKVYNAQIIRCSSSVYANYRAAQRAKSAADFIHKLKIVEEECDETIGFLTLLKSFNPTVEKRIDELIQEGDELLRIIVASINSIRKRIANPNNQP